MKNSAGAVETGTTHPKQWPGTSRQEHNNVMQPDTSPTKGEVPSPPSQKEQRFRAKRAGLGLPCISCRAYYAADLTVCPVCRANRRVLPIAAPPQRTKTAQEGPNNRAEDMALEVEHDWFLRDYTAQTVSM